MIIGHSKWQIVKRRVFFNDGAQNNVWDLWNYENDIPFPGRPAKNKLNAPDCTDEHQNTTTNGTCIYEDALFENRVHHVIRNHDVSKPLFMFWSTHIVHGPLEVPTEQESKFNFIDVLSRRKYHSMVNWIDGAIGRVVENLKSKNMYANTLIVFTSDNGGPLPSGSNWPLKGGKFSNWEGGIRTAAFASGGFLPDLVRGTVQSGLIGGWDWYATFAGLAGVDPTDHRAQAAGLPPIDSVDIWPLLSGKTDISPRKQIVIGSNVGGWSNGRTSANTTVGGLIVPPYKLLVGYGVNNTINMASWPGPISPNSSKISPDFADTTMTCGRDPQNGCLFDVYADPTEHFNLAAEKPSLFKNLLKELDLKQKGVYSPLRDGGVNKNLACEQAKMNGNFWGPFIK